MSRKYKKRKAEKYPNYTRTVATTTFNCCVVNVYTLKNTTLSKITIIVFKKNVYLLIS